MRYSPLLQAFVCANLLCAATVVSALADSVTLNSGEQLEGKILNETDTQLTIDVKVAEGITDQRVLAKTDIKSVNKTTPEEVAYAEGSLKNFKVGPNSFQPAAYESMLLALNNFQTKFPGSAHSQEVQLAIDALKQEQARVRGGELKWNNQWYNAKETSDQKERLGGEMVLANMREQLSRNDYIGALNTFDKLEKNYSASSAYPDAIELALPAIRRLVVTVDQSAAVAKLQEKQFNDGVALARDTDRAQMQAVHNGQVASANAALNAAIAAGVKWPPLLPMTPRSPEAIKKTAAVELQRLAALPVANIRQSIALTNGIPAALAQKNLTAAEENLKQAQTLWASNGALKPLTSAVDDAVKADKAAKAIKKPTPTPTPTPKPTPKPTPVASTPAPTQAKPWWNPF